MLSPLAAPGSLCEPPVTCPPSLRLPAHPWVPSSSHPRGCLCSPFLAPFSPMKVAPCATLLSPLPPHSVPLFCSPPPTPPSPTPGILVPSTAETIHIFFRICPLILWSQYAPLSFLSFSPSWNLLPEQHALHPQWFPLGRLLRDTCLYSSSSTSLPARSARGWTQISW